MQSSKENIETSLRICEAQAKSDSTTDLENTLTHLPDLSIVTLRYIIDRPIAVVPMRVEKQDASNLMKTRYHFEAFKN